MKEKKTLQLNKAHADEYVIYTRKSTDDADNQKNSIDYQIAECIRFAEREGYKIANLTIPEFCTNGRIAEHHSGFEEDNVFAVNDNGSITIKVERPKFHTLVNLIQRKAIKGIIVLCWDRISRNESDDAIIKKLMRQGCEIIFVLAKYDNSSSGALHMDIDGMFSRHYSRVISEKVKTSNRKLLAEGRCLTSAPIGYLNMGSDNKIFDPERAALVKRIFELYATGEWSVKTLVAWAQKNELTTRPTRRKRSAKEKALGVAMADIPKVSRPLTRKSIENILKNPFYTGKITHHGTMFTSNAHQALIDNVLFFKVQGVLKSKTTSIRYMEPMIYTYRGILRCGSCGRIYTAYSQKEINYYRPNCKECCTNTTRNTNEKTITKAINTLLNQIHLTDKELIQIETVARTELDKLTDRRNKEVEDLHRLYNRAMADYDYLIKDKLNLLRTGVFTPEQVKEEEVRLKVLVEGIQARLDANVVSTQVMLDYVIAFSELIKNKSEYFIHALDSEKRGLIKQVFYELSYQDGELKYKAKPGFEELLRRFDVANGQTGGPDYLVYELLAVYPIFKETMIELKNQGDYPF